MNHVWSLFREFWMNQFSSKPKCRTTFPSKTKVVETFPTLSGPRKHSTQVFWTSGTQDFELCFDRTPVRVVLILLCCEICHAVACGSISQQSAQSLHFQKCALLPPLVIKTARLSVALIWQSPPVDFVSPGPSASTTAASSQKPVLNRNRAP